MPASLIMSKVIDVPATTGGKTVELVMSSDEARAIAYHEQRSNVTKNTLSNTQSIGGIRAHAFTFRI